MIAAKSINDEGIFPLLALVDTQDPIIRDGVLAMIAERHELIEKQSSRHWTGYQASRHTLQGSLDHQSEAWLKFTDVNERKLAIKRFKDYAMQWY